MQRTYLTRCGIQTALRGAAALGHSFVVMPLDMFGEYHQRASGSPALVARHQPTASAAITDKPPIGGAQVRLDVEAVDVGSGQRLISAIGKPSRI